jgi:hypothetical protein
MSIRTEEAYLRWIEKQSFASTNCSAAGGFIRRKWRIGKSTSS